MSYERGTATDFSDLMSKLITFATTYCGFTLESSFSGTQSLNYSGAAGATSYTIRCLSRGGVYWWFRYTTANMFCKLSTGTGATWSTIASAAPVDTEVNTLTGSYSLYEFFEVDDSLHVMAKNSNGSYKHFSFGKIQKVGSWTGGEYFFPSYNEVSSSTYYNDYNARYHTRLLGQKENATDPGDGSSVSLRRSMGVIRCTYNSKTYALVDHRSAAVYTGMNCAVSVNGFRRKGGTTNHATRSIDSGFSPNAWSDTASAQAPYLLLYDDAGAGRYFNLGYLTGVRFVNVKYMTDDALVHTDWRTYPLSYRGTTGSASYAASGDTGIAFQEVA